MKRYILLLSMMMFAIIVVSSGCMGVKQESILVHNLGQDSILVHKPQEVVQALSQISRVYIYPDPDNEPHGPQHILVYPEVVFLEFGTNHSVTWEKVGFGDSGSPEFTINFNKKGSPFSRDKFDHSNRNSGKANKRPNPAAKSCRTECYDYQVEVPGYISLDPAIIVWD